MTELRVLIISDDHLARAGLAALLQAEESLGVVGQVDSNTDLQAAHDTYQPDALLWDLGWEVESTIEALAEWLEDFVPDEGAIGRDNAGLPELLADNGQTPLVVLISHEGDAAQVWALGVRAILLRSADGDTISAALNAAVHGLVVLEPAFTSAVTTSFERPDSDIYTSQRASEKLIEPLTPRELEVLQLIAQGHPNKSIARELEISEHTVKFHVNAILGKFNAASRTEAVVRATQAGLLLL